MSHQTFAHGSGSSRLSRRNRQVASVLNEHVPVGLWLPGGQGSQEPGIGPGS
jgi:hypothetical protein